MTLDLEAIARRTNSELSSLKLALPLLEQGYSPPFLARYRRDELHGLSEPAMWAVFRAMRDDAWLRNRRDDLLKRLEALPNVDPAVARAVRGAGSKRVMDRLARRVRTESNEANSPIKRIAARVLSPEKGDAGDVKALAAQMELAADNTAAIEAAIVGRLAVHPQLLSTGVRWLFGNAKIRILSVSDTHADPSIGAAGDDDHARDDHANPAPSSASAEAGDSPALVTPDSAADLAAADSSEADDAHEDHWPTPEDLAAEIAAPGDDAVDPLAAAEPTAAADESAAVDESAAASADSAANVGDAAAELPSTSDPGSAASEQTGAPEAAPAGVKKGNQKGKGKSAKLKPVLKVKELKTPKKISPRQRRRRWLVSVLQPLAGKELLAQKLTAFQTLMIGRGLRSGVVQCQFVYDTQKLTEQLQRTAASLNEAFAPQLREWVAANEAVIREAAEGAWWDELLESAASRLVTVAADHLDSQINRGGTDAKIVLAIDAMGPRTAAVAIVSADGRMIHTEDIACQLTAAMRSTAVTRLGELIHQYGVDLIVVSNGPARRGCLVILHELVEQSPPGSIRWTVADRSGADIYAGSEIGNREMRSTPRRFRSAAWLAFSVLRPSQAVTKVDPLRLRLGSFQRELSEDALWPALRDVMTSGVSRGGVDVNSAPVDWLSQLPGMNRDIAVAIDRRRREKLFTNRSEILELPQWRDQASARQAIPFLRVFGSSESLDGTLIHPDDYVLAKKLANVLKIELPPATPPGYREPKFDEPAPAPSVEPDPPASSVEEISPGSSNAVDNFAADIQPIAEDAADSDAEAAVESVAADASAVDVAAEVQSDAPEAAAETAAVPEQAASSGEQAASSGEQAASSGEQPEPIEVLQPIRHPLPEENLISKCIKEWQVGARRVRTVVEALCNPFGDEDSAPSHSSHAVMTNVPKVSELKPGDQVIGVVVGVTEFGAFVEMSPDCSGLVHVSRVADRFVEDLHEAVQVGDVITAWVTNIDNKRRRVGLSAISPQREMELEQQRRERREESANRGRYGRDDRRGGPARGGNRGEHAAHGQTAPTSGAAAPGGQSRGRSDRPGDTRGEPRGDARGGRGDQRGGQRPDSRGGDARGGKPDARGGRGGGRDNRFGGKQGGRGDRSRDRDDDTPTSYSTKVPRNEPVTPITEAMAKGDEPMRSFGDLLQFFKKAEPTVQPKTVEPAKPLQIGDDVQRAPTVEEPSAKSIAENASHSEPVVDGASSES